MAGICFDGPPAGDLQKCDGTEYYRLWVVENISQGSGIYFKMKLGI